MANFNSFPVTYQPMYPANGYYYPQNPQYITYVPQQNQQQPPIQSTQQQIQQQAGGLVWVQGIEGAKSYTNVQPGAPVALWDSEEQTVYIKSIDQTGKPQMTILDYFERDGGSEKEKKVEQTIEYVPKEQFDLLSKKLEELSGAMSNIENKLMNLGNKQQQNNNRKGNAK